MNHKFNLMLILFIFILPIRVYSVDSEMSDVDAFESMTFSIFEEVRHENESIIFKMKDIGPRYNVVKQDESWLAHYGEEIILSQNESINFISRNFSVFLESSSQGSRNLDLNNNENLLIDKFPEGYIFRFCLDYRSFGKGQVEETFFLVSPNSKQREFTKEEIEYLQSNNARSVSGIRNSFVYKFDRESELQGQTR